MARMHKIYDTTKLYFVTFTIVEWLDIFIARRYSNIIIESLKYCQNNKHLEVYAYVIMTNHLHLILRHNELPAVIRDFKKFTSYKFLSMLKEEPNPFRRIRFLQNFKQYGKDNSDNFRYQFWQKHNQPIELSSNKFMDQKLEYIHLNPVRAGFVNRPEEYLYSSAKNYYGLKDYVLEVKFIQ